MANPTVIVGAGLAGLMAARRLQEAGRAVVVLEAGSIPGGRLATRKTGRARLDHGAQFFTVRSSEFAALVDPLQDSGLIVEWCRGFNEIDGYPRYTVRGGMEELARHLAAGLDVRFDTAVTAVQRSGTAGYRLTIDGDTDRDGEARGVEADAVVLTPPVPLLLPLLAAGGIALDPSVAAITYHRVLALLVTLDRPSGVPSPGGHQSEDLPFSFIGDNHQKGISEDVSVTFHTNHRLSAQHWDDPDDDITARLLAWAQPWLGGAAAQSVELVRWKHSGPLKPWPQAVVEVDDRLLIAGDAFAGPKIEGAFLSGCAAAAKLLNGS